MGLTRSLRASLGTRLLVTPRFERYIAATSNILVDQKVAEFVKNELSQPQRYRRMTFSASARGQCPREQVFQFTGAKPIPSLDSDLHMKFHQGTFMHLKWQALLLDAGILDDVERPCVWKKYNLTGTIDGVGLIPEGHDLQAFAEFGWEFKSANERSFRWICERGPSRNHLQQIHAYMLATGLRVWSLMYENKNDQTWKEFVVHFDQTIADEVENELWYLNDMVDSHTLPPILSDCQKKKGPFKTCAFRDVCLTTTDWPERVLKMRRRDVAS